MPSFSLSSLYLSSFGSSVGAGSWLSNDRYPRLLGDVNGDGTADIIGFGEAGTYVSLTSRGDWGPSFGPLNMATPAFGASIGTGGWSSDNKFPRRLGDINGDGRADIVGFGSEGTYVALSNGDGTFGTETLATAAFGFAEASGGWVSNDRNPRMLADVNGDGRDDIVGFGNAGVYVSLSSANGTFLAPTLATTAFGADASAGGWSRNADYPRMLADMNHDDRADIIGFGNAGVYVSFATADGTFADPFLASEEFGLLDSAGGWSSNDMFPRMVASFDRDGIPDIIGFGNDGVFIALGRGDGTFLPAVHEMDDFGVMPGAGGWISNNATPRMVADLDGNGRDDIFGFAEDGVYVAVNWVSPWEY